MAKITITETQTVDVTPELLAKMFSELDADDQAKFFNEVDFVFHGWGEEGYELQTFNIAHNENMANGKIFIGRLAQE